MARERTSIQMKQQIRHLHEQGYSFRAIARALRLSRKTVRKALGLNGDVGGPTAPRPDWYCAVDWEKVRDEVNRRGTTIKQLHREYAPGVPYLTFWRAFRQVSPVVPDVTMRLVHKPGERIQIDFTDGIAIVDPATGYIRRTHLFTGVLPFSSRVFAEFVFDQRLATFIAVQERMWRHFGGVTPYLVVDNLKSGVHRADIYDPDVNPVYTDYANHMGFAVLPARPRRPRDKGKNESNNGVIQRTFFQEVRDRVFYSLADLNRALADFLARLDHEVMKDYGVSRMQRFEEERCQLRALPLSRFEPCDWRKAKVHPDCHIQVVKNFYSVPHAYVGRHVRVRVTDKVVEIFNEDGEALSAHRRLEGCGKFATLDAHYPEAKLSVACFEIAHAKAEAALIGPNTRALVDALTSGTHPLKHLRRVQGVLRLHKSAGVSRESLEYAASQAVAFKQMRLAYIKSCAIYHQLNGGRPVSMSAPRRDLKDIHLHRLGPKGGGHA